MRPEDLIIAPEVSRDYEPTVHEVFATLGAKHEGGSADLALLPYDPEVYPFQRLDVIGIRGKRVDVDTIRALGRGAYKHFDDIEAQFADRQDLLNHVAMAVVDGRDVMYLYDHSTIINGAVVGAAGRCALLNFAANELHTDLSMVREDIIISKLVTRLAAFGSIPAPEVLSNIWDTFFSIPPSRTIRGSAIPEETRQATNRAMLRAYKEPADEAATVGAIHTVHGSGSTDVEVRSGLIGHRQRTVHMGPLANGTVGLMADAMILPIGATLGDKEPTVTIGHLRNPIGSPEEAHGIMGNIARMNSEATGNEYIYHPTQASFAAAVR
jgi:hypothetical protein